MITKEQIEKSIKEKEKYFEIIADEKMQFLTENGFKIKGFIELKKHIADSELMSDFEFYNHMVKNDFARYIERTTDDKELINAIKKLSEKIIKKLNIPEELTNSEKEQIMRNKKITEIMKKGRKELIKIIESKIKPAENEKKKILQKLKKEDERKRNTTINQAYLLTLKGEIIEKKLIENLIKKKNMLQRMSKIENEMKNLLELKLKDEETRKKLKKLIEENLKHAQKMDFLNEEIELQHEEIFNIKNKITNMLENEFNLKETREKIETLQKKPLIERSADLYKKISEDEVKKMLKESGKYIKKRKEELKNKTSNFVFART